MSRAQPNSILEPDLVGPTRLYGYTVIDLIGQGAGSTIYAVSHPLTSQVYALKHVRRQTDRDARFIEQLENEYEVGRRVSHPVIRRPIDYQTTRKLFKITDAALILELFDGQPLAVSAALGLPETLAVYMRVAEGLDALHRHGYVHCDLKPGNILVGQNLEVRLIDLGQACPIGTAKTRIQGTPDFIAPEQVRCQPVDPRTDIYNFGASLYWSLAGKKLPTLFTAGRKENSFVAADLIPTPHQLNPAVPEPLSNLVMECVRSKSDRRPATMSELLRRLEIMHHVACRDVGRKLN